MQVQNIGYFCSDQTENWLDFPATMRNDKNETRVNLKDTQGFSWTSSIQPKHLIGTTGGDYIILTNL